MNVERVDTQRLVGTRISAADLDRLRSLYQDPQVAETLGGLRTDEWIAERLAFELGHWTAHGFGAWVFVERGSGEFVGRGAVRHAQIAGMGLLDGDQIELGYALRPEHWGRGLATEMAGAMVTVARDELCLPELAAWTLTTNRASQQVLEKTGFVYQRDFEYRGVAAPLLLAGFGDLNPAHPLVASPRHERATGSGYPAEQRAGPSHRSCSLDAGVPGGALRDARDSLRPGA